MDALLIDAGTVPVFTRVTETVPESPGISVAGDIVKSTISSVAGVVESAAAAPQKHNRKTVAATPRMRSDTKGSRLF